MIKVHRVYGRQMESVSINEATASELKRLGVLKFTGVRTIKKNVKVFTYRKAD